ncbi:MAG: PTS sugar transporter subunit IIB [Burkholderiaceae bacterium]|nr:PTS sugar transporter subunit IIB [Burkholderiaceae bacterium]
MIGIMVVSHEPLGTALIHCTRHIFGRLPPQLAALDVIPDEDPQAALAGARELLARINDGSGVVVLTDIYGATPSRIAQGLAAAHRVVVLAGANLPMLVKALNHRREPLESMVEALLASARAAIVEVPPVQPEGDDDAQR